MQSLFEFFKVNNFENIVNHSVTTVVLESVELSGRDRKHVFFLHTNPLYV